ncbi:hypothetical protein DFA_05531 [Cavenderia fasciculata]|uniref:rRNA methyltransferase 1, mitochondrial n=1 Tax=Cavenderia fasciculata TaxID=261658 RepID=F4PLH7_CACFS|nr:uncharacterized protein DFA_05531 [Cavenderia fasciculata]EGG23399.1 hypothetical protein DFA_05531 [Cavenderia fasciculata]|eukprot:XP_004361250.1 hypothetical protein DFA_05531 [Cavenderia fasciculata]
MFKSIVQKTTLLRVNSYSCSITLQVCSYSTIGFKRSGDDYNRRNNRNSSSESIENGGQRRGRSFTPNNNRDNNNSSSSTTIIKDGGDNNNGEHKQRFTKPSLDYQHEEKRSSSFENRSSFEKRPFNDGGSNKRYGRDRSIDDGGNRSFGRGDRSSSFKKYNNDRSFDGEKNDYLKEMDRINQQQKEKYQIQGEALFGLNPIWISIFANNRSFNALYLLDSTYSRLKFGTLKSLDTQPDPKRKGEVVFDGENEQEEEENEVERYNDKKNVKAVKEIIKKCKELGVPVYPVKKQLLDTFSKWNVHNGMVMDCSPLTAESIDKLQVITKEAMDKLKSPPLVVALDEIWDPQNTGAIIRTCHFFGVSGVVTTDKHSSPLTPVASKASAGALEDTPIYKTMSMYGFLKGSKENGWKIMGTSLGEDSKPLNSVKLTQPTILVIGNEGFGVSDNIIQECDETVKIPVSNKANPKLESLNASVSAGIVINHLLNK